MALFLTGFLKRKIIFMMFLLGCYMQFFVRQSSHSCRVVYTSLEIKQG